MNEVDNLSKEELEAQVLEKTKEFQKLNEDLEERIKQRTLELENFLLEQDKSTKLLFRRDLELTRANEKLRQLDEIKSNFISVVAHQLRTPLSGVKWTLSMILGGDLGELNTEQRTFLMKTDESNNRMIQLVNDMLNTERIQSGKVQYVFKHMNIVDLLDNVIFEVSPKAAKNNITIKFKNKFDNLPQAYIDAESMRAVLQNLLENAIKYTIDKDTVEIDIQNIKDKLQISITDHGIGIPEKEQHKIFGRFFRAPNAVKKITDGSGLGLFITKAIVERNGGTIWFESKEGSGTTFYFTVPTEGKKN